jgi:hypothetical protein
MFDLDHDKLVDLGDGNAAGPTPIGAILMNSAGSDPREDREGLLTSGSARQRCVNGYSEQKPE